ncbi:unnamed protein product [Symbiodinium necroappetens]|uniref:START domain-containing protein n=1 Tax=Symbiodinium necroappetens TaxID=1628268 RepID=A0A813CRR9_9DINO|nr:unnamed protein product [Symbiodinium necroappetens]
MISQHGDGSCIWSSAGLVKWTCCAKSTNMLMPRNLVCTTGPITEEEVLSLLELEAEPTNSDAAGAGWIPIGSPELSVEYWRDMPGAEPSGMFFLRHFLVLPGISPAIASKFLHDESSRKKWDPLMETLEDPADERVCGQCNDIVYFRTDAQFGALPSCCMLHRRRKMSPCGTAHSAWISRDAPATEEYGCRTEGVRQWAERLQHFRLRRAVVGHVVRSHEDGCRIFTYVQMEATFMLMSLGPQIAPKLFRGMCGDFSQACRAELQKEPPDIDGEVADNAGRSDTVHFPQFFDMSAGDETGSTASEAGGSEASSHSAGLDFLGIVENKKLVPAVSAFRRLLRKSEKGATRRAKAEPHESHKGEPHAGGRSVEPEGGRRRRSSMLREKNRERQRGSMEAVAERLGEAVRLRSQHVRDSVLEVVLEEEDDGKVAKLVSSEAEKQASASASKPSANVASFGSEDPNTQSAQGQETDSMSSASAAGGVHEEDTNRRRESQALDSFFDRARVVRPEGSSAVSTTTASSRASSPCMGTPSASSPAGAGAGPDTDCTKVAKPTLAGAAWVLTQLCKETTQEPDLSALLPLPTTATEEPSTREKATDQVATRTLRGSLMSAEAFKFCFPQDICGVPLDSKAAPKDPGWKRSSNRNRRRATAV